MSRPGFEKLKETVGVVGGAAAGRGPEAFFNYQAEKMARENGITKEVAQRGVMQGRHNAFGEFVNKGAVNWIEPKGKQDAKEAEAKPGEKKAEQKPTKKKDLKGDILFYHSKEAERVESALKGSLVGEDFKGLKRECSLSYKDIEEEEIQADANKQAEIKGVYEKKYLKYAPSEDEPNGKVKKENFIKELEAQAKSAAEQLEVLKILNERVKDKLAILENSPDHDKKLQELIREDKEFGADLFKIMEINEHLRKEEKRWQRDMAAPKRFAEFADGIGNDLGRGCILSLVFFVGKFFKIGWESLFLKGKKADEKVRHFFKELTEETFELVSKELYYGGSLVGKSGRLAIAGTGKLANYANRRSIKEGVERAKRFRDETSKRLKEAIYGQGMAPTD